MNYRALLRKHLHFNDSCILELSDKVQITIQIDVELKNLLLSFKIIGIYSQRNVKDTFIFQDDNKEYLFTFKRAGKS